MSPVVVNEAPWYFVSTWNTARGGGVFASPMASVNVSQGPTLELFALTTSPPPFRASTYVFWEVRNEIWLLLTIADPLSTRAITNVSQAPAFVDTAWRPLPPPLSAWKYQFPPVWIRTWSPETRLPPLRS